MSRPPVRLAPSPSEVAARIEAERTGQAFLQLRDGEGDQRLVILPSRGRLSVGRDAANDVCLSWDEQVSRLHAELEWIGGAWTVADDGISRNGSMLNGTRLQGRRRLQTGDQLLFGATAVTFRAPAESGSSITRPAPFSDPPKLSAAQRRVLVALCRPYADGLGFATAATNKEIAAELYLSVEAVKTHLRAVAEKLGVADLPQNVKRMRLVERSFELGIITQRDLARPEAADLR